MAFANPTARFVHGSFHSAVPHEPPHTPIGLATPQNAFSAHCTHVLQKPTCEIVRWAAISFEWKTLCGIRSTIQATTRGIWGPPSPDRKITRKRYPFSSDQCESFSFSLCAIGAMGAAAGPLRLTNELLKIQHNCNYVELTRKSLILLVWIFDAWQKTRKTGLFCPFFRFFLWDAGPVRPPGSIDRRPQQ